MARKAPLLGLINQGKCLAVTHRAVLSRGSSLIAALSFMAGSLSILTRAVWGPGCQRSPQPQVAPVWWWVFFRPDCRARARLAWLKTGCDDDDDDDNVDDPAPESKTGVCDLCRSCGLQCDIMRGQRCQWTQTKRSKPPQTTGLYHCQCKRASLAVWLLWSEWTK